MRSVYFVFLIIANLVTTVSNAQGKKVAVQFIQNDAPKYADTEFIKLEELYSIDVNVFDEYYIYQQNFCKY